MEELLQDIIEQIKRSGAPLSTRSLLRIVRAHNKGIVENEKHFSKKQILPYYLKTKEQKNLQEKRKLSPELEQQLIATLRIKPRRSKSGVATITVLTKPWPCSGNCLYCPNDCRMPKSYLANEPACQRAERVCFDPYLQVSARLKALHEMGHATEKVELIVLGGTFSDYPPVYRRWFICEAFRALNDGGASWDRAYARCVCLGIDADSNNTFYQERKKRCDEMQARINAFEISYNAAVDALYLQDSAWKQASAQQVATANELAEQQLINEHAKRRMVGLVVEMRPDNICPESLIEARTLGCTKIQIGIQSLTDCVLKANKRNAHMANIARAFELLRLFGFKSHVHFMPNLFGATPESDSADYRSLVTKPAFMPDEIKLYPCVLIGGTALQNLWKQGKWQAYEQNELIDLLVQSLEATPEFCRVSRMIRDFSSDDILAGNKHINLRQTVEEECRKRNIVLKEIRSREIGSAPQVFGEAAQTKEKRLKPPEARTSEKPYNNACLSPAKKPKHLKPGQNTNNAVLHNDFGSKYLHIKELRYETSVSSECFLQWTDNENRIAAFLRLSLPHANAINALAATCNTLPQALGPKSAMIREVHVYGNALKVGGNAQGGAAQHLGLGRRLIKRAEEIARGEGFTKLNVISSVGTREYYRRLGFTDAGLYQQKEL